MRRFQLSTVLLVSVLAILHTRSGSFILIPLNGTDSNNCAAGQEFRSGSCTQCQPGTYRFIAPKDVPTRPLFKCLTFEESYGGRIEPTTDKCVKCPAGSFNPFFGVQTGTRCLPCPTGRISKPGAKWCFKCPPGRSSAPRSTVCARCPKGQFLTELCNYGRPKSLCSKCPRGSYADSVNMLKCTKCPTGSSTAAKGATSKDMCKPCGSPGVRCSCRERDEPWNQVSSYRPLGSTQCIRCPPETRALNPFATSPNDCKPCPPNSVYIFLEGCKKCAAGDKTFGVRDGGCRKKKEDPCPYGYFRTSDGLCQLCPPGYVMSNGQCELCPAGSSGGGFSDTQCQLCKFPEVGPEDRKSSCGCARNYFRNLTTYTCTPCPSGTVVDSDNHNQHSCDANCAKQPNHPSCNPDPAPCPWNTERDSVTKKCKKCEKGTISPPGRERCEKPADGCPKGNRLYILLGRFGWSYSCST